MFRVRKASLFTLVAVLLLLGGVYLLRRDRALAGVPLDAPAPAFRLEAPNRGPVSLADYEGDVVLLTFGRPSCAPGCTPQLATLADAMGRLGDRRSDVRVLIVTLDPDPDDPTLLAFTQDYDLGFTGLRGDSAAVRQLEAAYREAERYTAGPDGVTATIAGDSLRAGSTVTDPIRAGSTVADSIRATAALAPDADGPRVYGIDRAGRLRAVWGPGDPVVLARDIRTLLRYR